MFTDWYLTDPDCCQLMRKDGSRYEMIQAVWLDTTKEDEHEYCICKGEIDINNYDDDEIVGAIRTYGYNIVGLLEEYSDCALDIIAECILEEEIMQDGCVIANAYTFEEAKEFIDGYIQPSNNTKLM